MNIFLKKCLAYAVHILTASGIMLGMLSLPQVFQHNWAEAYNFLILAIFIDCCDGTLARWVGVKKILPNIDGTLLDNIVDFLIWSFIPAMIVLEAGLVPEAWRYPVIILICLASSYQFCQANAKTSASPSRPEEQHFFFKGFPSYWVFTVYYLLFLPSENLALNAVILLLCGILSFIPIKFIYPTRTKMFRKSSLILSGIWITMLLYSTWEKEISWPFYIYSLLYFSYYLAASAILTIQIHKLSRK